VQQIPQQLLSNQLLVAIDKPCEPTPFGQEQVEKADANYGAQDTRYHV
jgi:hypothetical protein